MINHNKNNNPKKDNPWAGLASYEDPETAERKLKFCGRDDDSYDLARLIMGNVFVTLYGKSGIGKTSLLNAGVFPELRKERYTPVSLRLGIRDEEHPQSYQTMIIEAVERVVKRTETINVIDEQQDQQSIDYLWYYFARHRFRDKDNKPTIPVIVFDQFEEVFRSHRDEAGTLLRQLDYLNDKDHTLDSCEVDGNPYRYGQNFRFIVSIREDDLYRLEDSIDNCHLPALKRCRYRLRGLSEQAKDIIMKPAEGLVDEDVADLIIETITKKHENEVDSAMLSLYLSELFEAKTGDKITSELVKGGEIIKNFYEKAIDGIPESAVDYLEDNLLSRNGNRENITIDAAKHDGRLTQDDLNLLIDQKKILRKFTYAKEDRIELIHDKLCEVVVERKRMREIEKNNRRRLHIIAASVILLTGIALGFIFWQQKELDNIVEFDKDKPMLLFMGGGSIYKYIEGKEGLKVDAMSDYKNSIYMPVSSGNLWSIIGEEYYNERIENDKYFPIFMAAKKLDIEEINKKVPCPDSIKKKMLIIELHLGNDTTAIYSDSTFIHSKSTFIHSDSITTKDTTINSKNFKLIDTTNMRRLINIARDSCCLYTTSKNSGTFSSFKSILVRRDNTLKLEADTTFLNDSNFVDSIFKNGHREFHEIFPLAINNKNDHYCILGSVYYHPKFKHKQTETIIQDKKKKKTKLSEFIQKLLRFIQEYPIPERYIDKLRYYVVDNYGNDFSFYTKDMYLYFVAHRNDDGKYVIPKPIMDFLHIFTNTEKDHYFEIGFNEESKKNEVNEIIKKIMQNNGTFELTDVENVFTDTIGNDAKCQDYIVRFRGEFKKR